MAKGKVEICGVDTSKLPVLKGEQMRELFPRVHAGDAGPAPVSSRATCAWCSACCSAATGAKTWTTCFRWAASA